VGKFVNIAMDGLRYSPPSDMALRQPNDM